MGAFGQVSWTIVFNEKVRIVVYTLKTNDTVKTYAPRLDDTLESYTINFNS
jgi:hypothetical protein